MYRAVAFDIGQTMENHITSKGELKEIYRKCFKWNNRVMCVRRL